MAPLQSIVSNNITLTAFVVGTLAITSCCCALGLVLLLYFFRYRNAKPKYEAEDASLDTAAGVGGGESNALAVQNNPLLSEDILPGSLAATADDEKCAHQGLSSAPAVVLLHHHTGPISTNTLDHLPQTQATPSAAMNRECVDVLTTRDIADKPTHTVAVSDPLMEHPRAMLHAPQDAHDGKVSTEALTNSSGPQIDVISSSLLSARGPAPLEAAMSSRVDRVREYGTAGRRTTSLRSIVRQRFHHAPVLSTREPFHQLSLLPALEASPVFHAMGVPMSIVDDSDVAEDAYISLGSVSARNLPLARGLRASGSVSSASTPPDGNVVHVPSVGSELPEHVITEAELLVADLMHVRHTTA